jgi:hypothetical protein
MKEEEEVRSRNSTPLWNSIPAMNMSFDSWHQLKHVLSRGPTRKGWTFHRRDISTVRVGEHCRLRRSAACKNGLTRNCAANLTAPKTRTARASPGLDFCSFALKCHLQSPIFDVLLRKRQLYPGERYSATVTMKTPQSKPFFC